LDSPSLDGMRRIGGANKFSIMFDFHFFIADSKYSAISSSTWP
jgi:hypothetical protein